MTDGMGFWVKLHGNNFEAPMSALGHKRTLKRLGPMSALPPMRTLAAMSTRPKSTCCGRDDFCRNNHGVSVEPRTTRAAMAQHLHRETDAFIRTDSLGNSLGKPD